MLRFVNILHLFKTNPLTFWKIIREVRLSNQFQYENVCARNILETKQVKMNVDLLEKRCGILGESVPMKNVPNETLKTAAEMFTYMNLCSGGVGDLYKDIFKNSLPKQIILALISMMRKSNKPIEEKIWIFVTNKLNLTAHEHLKYVLNHNPWKRQLDNFTFQLKTG